jgi:hypothetical protein
VFGQVLVACTYTPSYLGGRDQEDHGSKPAQANSLKDPILKKHITKKGLVEWLKMKALRSSPITTKKEKSIWLGKILGISSTSTYKVTFSKFGNCS